MDGLVLFGFPSGLQSNRVRSALQRREKRAPPVLMPGIISLLLRDHILLSFKRALRVSPPFQPLSSSPRVTIENCSKPNRPHQPAQHLAFVRGFSDELKLIFHIVLQVRRLELVTFPADERLHHAGFIICLHL